MNPDDLEFHTWPPRTPGGQHTGRVHYGVLVVHKRTGAAVVVTSERSQHANQRLAEERLGMLLATLPWGGNIAAQDRRIAELESELTASTEQSDSWRTQAQNLAGRVGQLEAGLKEAMDWWAPGSHEFKSVLDEYDRLRKLLPSEDQ